MILRILAASLVAAVLHGQTAPQDPSEIRRRLSEVQTRLGQVEQQIAALKKRRKGLLVQLQDISLQTERAQAQADAARLRKDQTQAEIHAIGTRKEQIGTEIESLRGSLRKQVRWMQALGPWGSAGFLSSLKSFEDLLSQGRYQKWLRNRERGRLDRVNTLMGELHLKEAELKAALQRLRSQEEDAKVLQASLGYHEEQLQAFLDNLSRDEGKQKDAQFELAEEALQLERMLASIIGKSKTESFEPSVSFSSLRGSLPQPVTGSLMESFGEHIHPKFRTRTFRSGIVVQAPSGASVKAVADARVAMAEPYQSYGPMVILDHGGGFFTIYAHLLDYAVSKGQVVRAGDHIGQVGDTVDGPRLAFEVRQQTQPQDPQKWLKQKYR